MLVVLVGGITPVQTDVLFEKLSDCLVAEEQLRKAYTDALDAWDKRAALTFERRVTTLELASSKQGSSTTAGLVSRTQVATSQLPRLGSPISLSQMLQRRRQQARPADPNASS